MARLPQPGGDSGQWGAILNEFLAEAHNPDGSLKNTGILADKYTKPAGGIPKTDLTTAVQGTLEEAAQLNANKDSFATLDAMGKLLDNQLPASAIKNTYTVASEPAMLSLAAHRGDIAIRTDINKSYALAGDTASLLDNWKELVASLPSDMQFALDSINSRLNTMTVVVHYTESAWPSRPLDVGTVIWVSIEDKGTPPEAQNGDIIEIYSAPSVENGAILASFTFEDQQEGSPIIVSTPWVSSGGVTEFIAQSSAKVHGTVGGSITSAASYRQLSYNESSTLNTRVLDMYLKIQNLPALAYVMAVNENTTTRADVRINVNRTVTLRNGNVAVATSATAIDLDSVYRFSWKVSESLQELRIYNQYGALLEAISGTITNNQHDRMSFGMIALSSGFSGTFDSIRIGDNWLVPYV